MVYTKVETHFLSDDRVETMVASWPGYSIEDVRGMYRREIPPQEDGTFRRSRMHHYVYHSEPVVDSITVYEVDEAS